MRGKQAGLLVTDSGGDCSQRRKGTLTQRDLVKTVLIPTGPGRHVHCAPLIPLIGSLGLVGGGGGPCTPSFPPSFPSSLAKPDVLQGSSFPPPNKNKVLFQERLFIVAYRLTTWNGRFSAQDIRRPSGNKTLKRSKTRRKNDKENE